MKDINFLPTKDKRDAHTKSDKKEDIKWSKPAEDKITEDKKKSSGRFSFLKNNFAKDRKLKKGKFDKNKFKRSREEVLQLIKEKEYAKAQDNSIKSQGSKIKAKKKPNLLAWLRKFRKPKDDKSALADYQQQDFKEKQRTENISALTASVAPASATPFVPAFAPTDLSAVQDFGRRGSVVLAGKKATSDKKVTVGKQQTAEKSTDDKKNKEKKIKQKKRKEMESSSLASTNAGEKKKWENPDILETNLIKGEIIFFFNWRKGIIKLSIAVILVCAAIGLVYGGLDLWQKQKEEEIQTIVQKFIGLNQQIRKADQGVDEILAWQKKLGLVSDLLDNHIYWTNFFKFLEDNTLIDVYFPGGFSGNTGGNYNLSAVGVNYNTIHQQVKTLKIIDQVVKVSVMSGNFVPTGEDGQSSINFNLELSVDPEIFYK